MASVPSATRSATGRAIWPAPPSRPQTPFATMIRDELGYSKSTVSKLIAIAGDEKLREVSHAKLPASWDTLYALKLLTPAQFEKGIETGVRA